MINVPLPLLLAELPDHELPRPSAGCFFWRILSWGTGFSHVSSALSCREVHVDIFIAISITGGKFCFDIFKKISKKTTHPTAHEVCKLYKLYKRYIYDLCLHFMALSKFYLTVFIFCNKYINSLVIFSKVYWYWYQYSNIHPKNIEFEKYVIVHHYCLDPGWASPHLASSLTTITFGSD